MLHNTFKNHPEGVFPRYITTEYNIENNIVFEQKACMFLMKDGIRKQKSLEEAPTMDFRKTKWKITLKFFESGEKKNL